MLRGPRKGSRCDSKAIPHSFGWAFCGQHAPWRVDRANEMRGLRKHRAKLIAKIGAANTAHTEEGVRAEIVTLTEEMLAVGGWGSREHGRFHSVRKRWRDANSRLSAIVLGITLDQYTTIFGRSREYEKGGPLARCVDETCACRIHGVYQQVRGRVSITATAPTEAATAATAPTEAATAVAEPGSIRNLSGYEAARRLIQGVGARHKVWRRYWRNIHHYVY